MLVAALFRCIGIPFNGNGLLGNLFFVHGVEMQFVLCKLYHFLIFHIIYRTGIL